MCVVGTGSKGARRVHCLQGNPRKLLEIEILIFDKNALIRAVGLRGLERHEVISNPETDLLFGVYIDLSD